MLLFSRGLAIAVVIGLGLTVAGIVSGASREEVIGKSFDSVVARRGPPQNSFQMGNGNWVY